MNRNFHKIQTDGDIAESFGKELAEVLHLKKKNGFYQTTWGAKTSVGLARTIYKILTSPKP